MSDAKRSRVIDYLIYVAVRALVCVVQALSFEKACVFARFLGWLAYKINKRHRLVALENLRESFPGEYTEAELDEMVRAVYVHFCTVLIEMMHIPRRLRLHNYMRTTVLRDPDVLADVLLSGRPLLFVTGHFGNWELAGNALGLFGYHTYAIARTLDNPYLDDFLRAFRERTGQSLLAKRGDFDQIEGVLKGGGVLGTLADQDAGPRGVFVDFFGRPASTHKAVALMALEHNVPMVVCGALRRAGVYHICPVDVIYPEDYAKSPNAVHEITQRFTAGLERLVREAPEQYFWVHRRWKHQPPVRRKKKAAA